MTKKIISYKNTNESDLLTIGLRVAEKMKNNPAFSDPPAALKDLQKLLPKYRNALTKAKSGDKEMIYLKNSTKATLKKLLSQLASYVTLKADGNNTALLSSGFDVRQDRSTTLLPSTKILQVSLDNDGEATTCIKKITGARAYMHQYTTESPGQDTLWFTEGSSYRRFTFKKLQSAKRYWFRVVVIGSGGKNAYSDVLSKVIQ